MSKTFSRRRLVLTAIISSVSSIILALALIFAFMGRFAHTYIKLSEIDFLVRNFYSGDVSDADFDTAICDGYISQLGDKYAAYLPKEDAKKTFDSYEGVSSGIGVTVTQHPDTHAIYVINVSEGSPAEKAGVNAGDSIISVGGETVTEENYKTSYKKLTGNIGDKVEFVILRDDKEFSMSAVVDKYEIQSVFGKMIGDYGYVSITRFNDSTVPQFENTVNSLITSGAKGLIFDVMNNGGGTLDSVAKMLDFLMPEGVLIYEEYSDGERRSAYKSDKEQVDLPMVVLTNRATASASELFAISVRDFEKGVLIGERTYGKAVMQKTYKLDDGASVRFTVANVFSNSQTEYNGEGIEPDISVKLNEYQATHYYVLSDEENPYIQRAVEWLEENK